MHIYISYIVYTVCIYAVSICSVYYDNKLFPDGI